jgi:hypothetical protein
MISFGLKTQARSWCPPHPLGLVRRLQGRPGSLSAAAWRRQVSSPSAYVVLHGVNDALRSYRP